MSKNRLCVLPILLASTLAGLFACAPTVPPAPNNLVVICLDTVRHDSFLQREVEDSLTPWLASAQNYANTTSTAPWTMPAVASLFTGLYPVEHGAGMFTAPIANLDTEVPSALDASALTLAEIFDENYFRTGAFVSHPFFLSELGLRQGFQVVHNRRGWWRDLERMWQWVDRIKQKPARFFGYLHFMEAHHRHTGSNAVLEEHLATADPAMLDYLRGMYPTNCKKPDSRRCKQTLVYETAVMELRKAVASVLQDLQDRAILDQTLVVVYSDHGEEFWDHEQVQRQQSNDPRKHIGLGHGQSMYQELLQVPLLVWHPGIEGRVHPQTVSLIDVLPSVLRWMEIETPELAVSGKVLPPLYRDWFGSAANRAVHASGIAYGPEQVATRTGGHKSVFALASDTLEIFDLQADPGEQQPLDDDGLLFEFGTLTGDYLERPPVVAGTRGQLGAGALEDLKAIGYLQGVEEDAEPEKETPAADADALEEDGGDRP